MSQPHLHKHLCLQVNQITSKQRKPDSIIWCGTVSHQIIQTAESLEEWWGRICCRLALRNWFLLSDLVFLGAVRVDTFSQKYTTCQIIHNIFLPLLMLPIQEQLKTNALLGHQLAFIRCICGSLRFNPSYNHAQGLTRGLMVLPVYDLWFDSWFSCKS